MGQDWLLAMSIQDVPRRPGRVPAEAHAKGYFARVVDEYLQIGITTPRREQEAISIRADRSVLTCRPRCCLVDRLKAVAYGVEVVALQLAQVIAHTKSGYGKLLSPQCFDIACIPVLQFDAFCFRDGDVERFAAL